ncbi:hypothetical protein [Methanobacterium congolense]|uniref:Uncharacterized protein n=1 Tax=Methanobacterium congolense TaxID=118062 RepID=A0A1D3L440_9EURY|nr:hypothetical protein [Methanobacterium congolense]SCG86240.1 hypothetical protein MCBB_1685 [Methanobacterium congolense]
MEVNRILAEIYGIIYLLDVNMDSLLKKEALKTYLDASLYNTIKSSHKNVVASKKKVSGQLTLPI